MVWAGVAAATGPAAILLHELGHLVVGLLFGFPDLVMHYGSVTHSARGAGLPAWQLGAQTAAGPLVTLGIVGACCAAAARWGASAWTVAPALAAGVRNVAIGLGYLLGRVLAGPHELSPNFDEYNAALAFGLPPELVVALSAGVILTAWAYLIWSMPSPGRLVALGAAALGAIAGIVVYVGVLGPALLP